MKKNIINNELMSRFYTGDVTGDEFKMVLMAADKDPDLREEIEIMSSISDQLMDIRVRRADYHQAKIIAIQPAYIRPMLKAAQNKDLKAASDCVVRCEHEILKSYQPEVTLESLRKLSEESRYTFI